MPDLHVVLRHADAREERTVTTGTKAWELFADQPDVIAARVSGELRDLAHELGEGDEVEPVAIDSADGRDILRHSTAHVLAQAVQELFPDAKLGIGPPIQDGFYYDFDVETPFVPEDLAALETKMRKIIKEGQKFSRRAVDDGAALTELVEEPYKLELIGLKGAGHADDAAEGSSVEVGGGELTIYDNLRRDGSVAWKDLCRGPHLPTTKRIPAFKLMRSAAAYWRGDEKNKQLQRIYGTAWESKESLEEHLHRLEEAERRDHRKIGRELDLFSFPDEIGSGLVVFHPKGGVIKREMEDYVRRRHIEEGFSYVGTPHISKEGLFHTSGHLPYYADTMFPPMEMEGSDYYLKAMNCPMHNLIFRSRGRSYRELPLRLFEFGSRLPLREVRRRARADPGARDDPGRLPLLLHPRAGARGGQAPPGVLPGAVPRLRARRLLSRAVDPRRRQARQVRRLPGAVGRGDPDPGEGRDRVRARAGARSGRGGVLRPQDLGAGARRDRPHLADVDHPVRLQPAGRLRPRVRRRRRLAAAAGDDPLREVRLPGALLRGARRALRRAFPPWLAPVQVQGIPIAERHLDYLHEVAGRLRAAGIRVEVDESDERMQKKIRNAQLQKVPFMMIAGDDDIEAGAVSFRYRDGHQENGVPVAEAIVRVQEAVASRAQV